MNPIVRRSSVHQKAPLQFNQIPSPPTFYVMETAASMRLRKDVRVYYPRGFEDAKDGMVGSVHDLGTQRPTAPFPDAVRADGSEGAALRPRFRAYVAAKGIIHYDTRIDREKGSGGGGDKIALSTDAELRDALENLTQLRSSLGTSGGGIAAAHLTQPSRSVAITLVLPSAEQGKMPTNRAVLPLLDAFALVAESTSHATGDSDIGRVGKASPVATSIARFAVVAGKSDVSDFLSTVAVEQQLKSDGAAWKTNVLVCYSYVDGRSVKHTIKVLNTSSTYSISVSQALDLLQESGRAAQSECKVCLPLGMVQRAYVAIDDVESGVSPFLELQARLQRDFHELHFRHLHVEPSLTRDVMKRLASQIADSKQRNNSTIREQYFVRLAPGEQPVNEFADPAHRIGVLVSSDRQQLDAFLRKHRAAHPGVFVLNHPEDDEDFDASVLYWQDVQEYIGKDLCHFSPCDRFDRSVTDFKESRIRCLRAFLVPLSKVIDQRVYVIPVVDRCVVPDFGPRQKTLFDSFTAYMSSSIDELLAKATTAVSEKTVDGEASSPSCGLTLPQEPHEHSAFYSVLFGSRVQQPTSTLKDALVVVQNQFATECTAAATFVKAVNIAAKSMDHNTPLSDVFERMAIAYEERTQEELTHKRPKTPTSPSPSLLTSTSHPLVQITSANRLQSTDSLSMESIAETVKPTPRPPADYLLGHFYDSSKWESLVRLADITTHFAIPGADSSKMLVTSMPFATQEGKDDFKMFIHAVSAACDVELDGDVTFKPDDAAAPPPADDAGAAAFRVWGDNVLRVLEAALASLTRLSGRDAFAGVEPFAYLLCPNERVPPHEFVELKKFNGVALAPTKMSSMLQPRGGDKRKRVLFLMSVNPPDTHFPEHELLLNVFREA
jgi:hypothetical protein